VPVREYAHCGLYLEQFEQVPGMLDGDWPTCRKCGQPMDRLISAPSFRVKGFNADNGYTRKDSTRRDSND